LFLGLKRPVDRWHVTYGICPSCQVHWRTAPRRLALGEASRLLILSGDSPGIEAAGQLIGQSGRSLVVLMDRRTSERRRRQISVARDRRQTDRRRSAPASWADGYVFVPEAPDPEEIAAHL
jgi:hypothetical protein